MQYFILPRSQETLSQNDDFELIWGERELAFEAEGKQHLPRKDMAVLRECNYFCKGVLQ